MPARSGDDQVSDAPSRPPAGTTTGCSSSRTGTWSSCGSVRIRRRGLPSRGRPGLSSSADSALPSLPGRWRRASRLGARHPERVKALVYSESGGDATSMAGDWSIGPGRHRFLLTGLQSVQMLEDVRVLGVCRRINQASVSVDPVVRPQLDNDGPVRLHRCDPEGVSSVTRVLTHARRLGSSVRS